MGVVFRAHDHELGREVAVKVLSDRYQPGSATALRFVEEARITGQLQHPGIPPVYRVGTFPDGRPFLAMKLIKGRTLDALLKEQGGGATRWLGAFEAICHAVGYAHAHRVIHRDLKPANIMVGSFGEVQVMDWGLAKVLGEREREPASSGLDEQTVASTEIHSLRDSDGSFTQAGSVLGTPAFMAPEQAAGEVVKVGTRSDVFGLGAVLCALLTGHPPFGGANSDAVRLNAVRGKTEEAFARLDACGAEPELVALCKRCLGFEPANRPANAEALAWAVVALRTAAEARARQAELDRAKSEVQNAELRKRRRVQAALAVMGLLLAGSVGGGGWWMDRQATERRLEQERAEGEAKQRVEVERARVREAVESALAQAAERAKQERWQDVDTLLTNAADRLPPADEFADLAARLAEQQKNLRMVRDLDDVWNRRIHLDPDGVFDIRIDVAAYQAAFTRFGLDVLEAEPGRIADQIRTSPIRQHLLDALDDWAAADWGTNEEAKLVTVLKAADAEQWRDGFREYDNRRKMLLPYPDPDQVAALSPKLLCVYATYLWGRLKDFNLSSAGMGALLVRAATLSSDDYTLNLMAAIWLDSQQSVARTTAGRKGGTPPEPQRAGAFARAALALRPGDRYALLLLARDALRHGDQIQVLVNTARLIERDPNDHLALELRGRAFALAPIHDYDSSADTLTRAIRVRPNDPWLHWHRFRASLLGHRLSAAWDHLRAAVPLTTKSSWVWVKMAEAVAERDPAAAEKYYHHAVAVAPDDWQAKAALGVHHVRQRRYGDAFDRLLDVYRHYSAKDRRLSVREVTYSFRIVAGYLMASEIGSGRISSAAQTARWYDLRMDSTGVQVYHMMLYALGNTQVTGTGESSVTHIHAVLGAVRSAAAHTLGTSNPATADLRLLGGILEQIDDADADAEAVWRRVLDAPDHTASDYGGLASVLRGKKQYREALRYYQRGLEKDPADLGLYHEMAKCYRFMGEFRASIAAHERASELLKARGQQFGCGCEQQARDLLKVDDRVQVVVSTGYRFTTADEFVELSKHVQDYGERSYTAARLLQVVFTAQPRLADDLSNGHRYNAACYAARAAAGFCIDAPPQAERAALRRLAIEWLSADLRIRKRVGDDAIEREELSKTMAHWLVDDDLRTVRDADLAHLSSAEREQWGRFWDDVRRLYSQVTPREELPAPRHDK